MRSIGGGVDAYGPALLVRVVIFDKVSLTGNVLRLCGQQCLDRRHRYIYREPVPRDPEPEFGLAADYVYRDSQITIGVLTSHEPDYIANAGNIDVTQEVFGGMTTVSFGFTRANDTVKKHNEPEFLALAHAKHWQYRLGRRRS